MGLTPPNFADCLTIGEAAEFLGVSAGTLRNWDRSGKLKSRRHPQNGYRIYMREDLQAVLRTADLATLADEQFAPQFDWTSVGNSAHLVQFYESDQFLIDAASEFIAIALRASDASLIAVTAQHRQAIERKLAVLGIDLAEAEKAGRVAMPDAQEVLDKVMAGDSLDPIKFEEIVGGALAKLSDGTRRIHAFGEIVSLLWNQGKRDAAIELERFWNSLAERHAFVLLCAYHLAEFNSQSHRDAFQEICACHSRVIPAESYSAADTVDERLRAVTSLQQKAQSLEVEIEHRKQVEKALMQRQRELSDFSGTEGTSPAEKNTIANDTFRIVVVDDNQDAGRTLTMLLQIRGHQVRGAKDGLEAVAVAEEFRPDIILMDVGTPKLNGYEATRKIRALPSGNEIFIVALAGQAEEIARSMEAGCSAHIVKPVNFAELEQLLETVKKKN